MVSLYSTNFQINDIDTILFDKDGTFLDDHIYWGKLAELRIKYIIKHFNLPENLQDELCYLIGYNPKEEKLIKNGAIGVLSRNEVIDFMCKQLIRYNVQTGFETIEQIFNTVHKEFLNSVEKYTKFLPYAENFIRNLKGMGLKMAVVTSDTYEHTLKILEILNILDCFDCVIGKNSCEKDKKTGEPALTALKKLNTKKCEAVIIGDAQMDYLMAKNSGINNVILVATGQTDLQELKTYTKNVVKNLSEVFIK